MNEPALEYYNDDEARKILLIFFLFVSLENLFLFFPRLINQFTFFIINKSMCCKNSRNSFVLWRAKVLTVEEFLFLFLAYVITYFHLQTFGDTEEIFSQQSQFCDHNQLSKENSLYSL